MAEGSVALLADASIYPLDAIYGAAYVFIDRCFVSIDRPQPQQYRISLASKEAGVGPAVLRALVGEFGNELLACAWRYKITQDNRAIIEATTMQALAGAMGHPTLDDLAALDFSEEAFEDPLGIATSWEDKYGKGGKSA